MQETRVWSLGWEDPPEKGKATHCSILAWRIPWTVSPMGVTKSRTRLSDFCFQSLVSQNQNQVSLGSRLCNNWASDPAAGTSKLHALSRDPLPLLPTGPLPPSTSRSGACGPPLCESVSCSVVSNSLGPHALQPARLLCPWDSPGKNTGAGWHDLLQRTFLTQGSHSGLLPCTPSLNAISGQHPLQRTCSINTSWN